MANFIIQEATELSANNNNKEKSLLAFDDSIAYKLTLNEDSLKYLLNIGFLTGKRNKDNHSEIFNDYNNNKINNNHQYVHIEGYNNQSTNSNQHIEGRYNAIPNDNKEYLHIVGNGTEENNRSNAYTLDSEGRGYFQKEVTINTTNVLETLNQKPDVYYSFNNKIPDINVGKIGDIWCQVLGGE